MASNTKRDELVARYRKIGKALARFESLSDDDAEELEQEQREVQAQIDAIDAAVRS